MQRQVPLTANTSEGGVSGEEKLINVYPSESSGGKYPFTIVSTPGLAFFCELPTTPVLGLHKAGDRLFAVTQTKFYEVFNNGSFREWGDVVLSGRVSMEDNGNQVVVVDGKAGYYFDIATEKVLEITSDAFYPSATVTYQDGYFVFNRVDTGQFFISSLLGVDFNPLEFATAEGRPDKLIALISDHREVYLFGTETIEVWYNSGAADFPFERNQGAFIEKGCGAAYTIAKQNNTIYFVGSDLMVYQMAGYTPIRISNHAVEKSLKYVDLSDAFAYTYQDEGHLFYVLTIPERGTSWCYDIATTAWHERRSYEFGRHLSNCCEYFDEKTLVGDFQAGRIYQMTRDFYSDDGRPIIREFVLPTISKGREFLTIDSFELDMSSGVGIAIGQGDNPQARLKFSKDGGKTWSNDKFADIGRMGKYLSRVKWNRLGVARQFTVMIEISDPVPLDIGGAYIEVR